MYVYMSAGPQRVWWSGTKGSRMFGGQGLREKVFGEVVEIKLIRWDEFVKNLL